MRINIAVDANIIISALLGGKPSEILFNPEFCFVTTKFTIEEVRKYFPRIEKKIGSNQKEIENLLNKLPLMVYSEEFYKEKLSQAEEKIGEIDEKDVDILALALQLNTYVWSQDKDFEEADYDKILKTYNFINDY